MIHQTWITIRSWFILLPFQMKEAKLGLTCDSHEKRQQKQVMSSARLSRSKNLSGTGTLRSKGAGGGRTTVRSTLGGSFGPGSVNDSSSTISATTLARFVCSFVLLSSFSLRH
jgi:hypothetical protein